MTWLKSRRGFTLIEVLIVILIISITSAAVLLSIGSNDDKKVLTFLSELESMVSLAEEQAVLTGGVLGLMFNGQYFSIAQYVPTESKAKWLPLTDHALILKAPHHLVIHIQSSLANSVNADEKKTLTLITAISSNGDLTPFAIYMKRTGKPVTYVLIGEENGMMREKRIT